MFPRYELNHLGNFLCGNFMFFFPGKDLALGLNPARWLFFLLCNATILL